jgi:vacuolar-type H+-ATPase subunit D/Vma8
MDNQQILMSAIADLKRDVHDTKSATESFRNAFSQKLDKLQENVHVIDKNVTALQSKDGENKIKSLSDDIEKLETRVNILEDALMYFKGISAVIMVLYALAISLLFWWLNQK